MEESEYPTDYEYHLSPGTAADMTEEGTSEVDMADETIVYEPVGRRFDEENYARVLESRMGNIFIKLVYRTNVSSHNPTEDVIELAEEMYARL